MTIDALRRFGDRRVTVQSAYGTFSGTIVQELLSPASVLVLLAEDCDDERRVVLDVNDITAVVER